MQLREDSKGYIHENNLPELPNPYCSGAEFLGSVGQFSPPEPKAAEPVRWAPGIAVAGAVLIQMKIGGKLGHLVAARMGCLAGSSSASLRN